MGLTTRRQSSPSCSPFTPGKAATAAAGFNEAREDVVRSNYRDLSTALEEGVCGVSGGRDPRVWSTRPLFIVGIDVPDTRAALRTALAGYHPAPSGRDTSRARVGRINSAANNNMSATSKR